MLERQRGLCMKLVLKDVLESNRWINGVDLLVQGFFIGPESDHWQCLSLTDSLNHSCLVNLMALYDTNCLMMSQEKMVGILLNKKFLSA